MSSYAPLALPDLDWAILAEIDADEAFAPITRFTRNLALGLAAILLAALLLLWFVSRRLVAPIVVLDGAARRIGRRRQIHLEPNFRLAAGYAKATLQAAFHQRNAYGSSNRLRRAGGEGPFEQGSDIRH